MFQIRLRFQSQVELKTPELSKSFKLIFAHSPPILLSIGRGSRFIFRFCSRRPRSRDGFERPVRRAGFPARGGIASPENILRGSRGVLEAGAANQTGAGGNFRAVAFKRFALIKRAAVNFIVAIGITAPGQANRKIGIRPETIDEAEIGIQINRRDGQSQREVRAQEIRLVVVIKRVARQRRMAFKSLVVAELHEVARGRINLRGSEPRDEQP